MEKYQKAVEFIRKRIKIKPEIGMVLGSGLGQMADYIEDAEVIDYSDIPISGVDGGRPCRAPGGGDPYGAAGDLPCRAGSITTKAILWAKWYSR